VTKGVSVLEIIQLVQSQIAGQSNAAERQLLNTAVSAGPRKPRVALEVGTWLGDGSTAHILEAMQQNEEGLLSARKIAAHPSAKSLQRARLALLKMRCAPVELTAALTPRFVCGFVYKLFPQFFARVLVDGRK